jgi:hypothetical protein
MKKLFFQYCFTFLLVSLANGQQSSKVNQASEKVKNETQKVVQQSQQIGNDAALTGQNIEQIISNAKIAARVFEPILKLRLRKKMPTSAAEQSAIANEGAYQGGAATAYDPWFVPPPIPEQQLRQDSVAWQQTMMYQQYSVQQSDLKAGVPVITQSATYNPDGTANLGNQNSKKYGCYVNILNGAIMDEIDAAGNSKSIDLIFTSTDYFNENVPMYAFLTPAYAKNDKFAYNFFKGTKYKDQNIPPKLWEEVNESEVAMTNLTGEQFERIQTNQQLNAVIKQIAGFAQKIESRTKLDGKVIAVKTEMGDRTAYGLLYIVSHTGTFGENAFLKVKIKVTGLDATGDGNPDPGLYIQ